MRFGFIGGWGHHYLRGSVSDEDEVIVSSDGRDAEAARGWMGRLRRGARWVDSPEALLEARPDVVSVGAMYALNGDLAIAALERDLPVICDKPVAASWEQLGRVRRAAEGRILVTEFDMRCRAEFAAARRAVTAGLIGMPVLATAQKSYRWGTRPAWYGDRAMYSGTLMWVASHGIDAMGFVTGEVLTPVAGRGGNLSHPGHGSCEDHVVTLFSLSGGGTGVAHADFLRPAASPTHGDDRIRVVGSEGVVEIREGRCVLITNEHAPEDITDTCSPRLVGEELLAVARGATSDVFSTEHTLELAELLLRSRDVTDGFQPPR